LSEERRRRLREYGLTVGELGSSGGQTVVVALLPVLLAPYAPSAVWIGAIIATEGLFALAIPYFTGVLSDRLPPPLANRYGRRTLFLLTSAPVMAAALIVMPFQRGFWALSVPAFVFFAAFNVYTTLLRTLLIDVVPTSRWGRVQGFLGVLHAGGLGYGLVAGGLLFAVWSPLPFLLGAALIVVFTATTYGLAPRNDSARDMGARSQGGNRVRVVPERLFWSELVRRSDVGWFLVANGLWTGAVDGLRPYIFLYAAYVLGTTVAETSLLLVVMLIGVAIGAYAFGRAGDRLGRGRVLLYTALGTAGIMALGTGVRTVPGAIAVLVPAGLGAAAFIALPYPVFVQLASLDQLGRFTGVYSMSVGVARFMAPLVVGRTIDFGARLYPELYGYPLLWPVVALMMLLGAVALKRADRLSDGRLLARPGAAGRQKG